MKLAVLYAGQGAQHPGMGKEFYEDSPAFRAAFDSPALHCQMPPGTRESLRKILCPCRGAVPPDRHIKRQASLILPPFGHKFIHQLLYRAHSVQPAHVGPAEEQALLHIALYGFDERVGDAVGHLGGVAGLQAAGTVPGREYASTTMFVIYL